MNPTQDNQYDMESALQATQDTTMPKMGNVDIASVGKKVKQIYPTGIASDGRRYADMSDEEIGSKYLLKNGDKGLTALGMSTDTQTDTKETASLRKEFHNLKEIKDYKNVLDSWNRAKAVPDDGSGDLTLLYSYIKALDPDSVVREGEINISKATASVPENIVTAYQRVKEGKLLSAQQRKEYQSEIGRMYNARAEQAKQSQAFYSGLATDMQADPSSVTGGIGEIQMAEVPEVQPKTEQGISGPTGLITGALGAVTDLLIPETKKVPERGLDILEKQAQIQQKHGSTKGDLMKSAQSALDQTLGIAPDVIGTAIGPAVEGSVLKGAPAAIKSVGSKLPNGAGFIKDVATKGPTGMMKEAFGNKRTEAALKAAQEGITVSGKEAVKVGKEYLKNVPLAKEAADEIFPTLNKAKMGIDEALKKMEDLGSVAYTKGGDPKSTAQGQLINKLYGSLRKQIETVAPEVGKQQGRLAKTHELEKATKKAFSPFTLGVGATTAAGTAIYNLLKGN